MERFALLALVLIVLLTTTVVFFACGDDDDEDTDENGGGDEGEGDTPTIDIVPGERIGSFPIETTVTELAALVQADDTATAAGGEFYFDDLMGNYIIYAINVDTLQVYGWGCDADGSGSFTDGDVILTLAANPLASGDVSPLPTTEQGHTYGATLEDIQDEFGPPDGQFFDAPCSTTVLYYNEIGLTVSFAIEATAAGDNDCTVSSSSATQFKVFPVCPGCMYPPESCGEYGY